MAETIQTLDDAIAYINTIFNTSSTPPTSGEEDYLVWTSFINIAINVWEQEDYWRELYTKLSAAPDGVKTTTQGVYSYATPTLFKFPAVGFIWTGDGTNKTAYKIIKPQDKQLYENNSDKWCYFLVNGSPTLEFNPNCPLNTGDTINYEYYKKATKLVNGSDVFEMNDPMFAVYFTLAELTKEEGNTSYVQMMGQKLEEMSVQNIASSWHEDDSFINGTELGLGTTNTGLI